MDDEMLSPLEQELLDEYSNLLRNMNRVSHFLSLFLYISLLTFARLL